MSMWALRTCTIVHFTLYSAVSQKLLAEHGKTPDYDFKMKVNDKLKF